MAPDLGLTSLTPFTKSRLPQTQFESMLNHNTNQMPQDEEDSWEVRAFEEDTTGNLLGCTWPPRSYTCAFCRREFRSAQALGGHMNVHRRDRARLHEMPLVHPSSNISPPPSSAILIPTVANGLCLLYPYLPANPNSILLPNPPPIDFSSPLPPLVSSACHSPNTAPSPSSSYDNHGSHKEKTEYSAVVVEEELDLELRLGRRHSHGTP